MDIAPHAVALDTPRASFVQNLSGEEPGSIALRIAAMENHTCRLGVFDQRRVIFDSPLSRSG